MNRCAMLSALMAVAMLLGGCKMFDHSDQWASVDRLVAVIQPTEGNKAHGTVWFTQVENGVKVIADIHGLTPNSKHAMHVHDYGDLTGPDGKSAGDHYNPQKMAHGRPEEEHRHAGDLGNLPPADANGSVHYERVDKVISLVGLKNPIIGRSVVIHAGEDKFTGMSGDAGARIGVGVIGIAQPRPTKQ